MRVAAFGWAVLVVVGRMGGGLHSCSIHIHLVGTCLDAVENLFLPLISVLPLFWNLMMWGFHQQLQLSVEWSEVTAASVLFSQPLKLDKLPLLDCTDSAKRRGDVKCGNGARPVWCTSPHLPPHKHRQRRIPQTNWGELCKIFYRSSLFSGPVIWHSYFQAYISSLFIKRTWSIQNITPFWEWISVKHDAAVLSVKTHCGHWIHVGCHRFNGKGLIWRAERMN